MLSAVLSLYRLRFANVVVYMLQSTEYQVGAYLRWLWRTENFSRVMHRRELQKTRPAKLLLAFMRLGMMAQAAVCIALGYWWITHNRSVVETILVIALLLFTPIIWANLVIVPLALGRWLIIKPYYWFEVQKSKQAFARTKAAKIAIAGSYGKTTMKEILLTVLNEGHKVAATPANRNVSISHAQFAKSLKGDEEILIIEYGEGAPGDVARFTKVTRPNMGIITGLAPAHLDKYKTLRAAGEDIFFLADYLQNKEVYVNGESKDLKPFVKKGQILYTSASVAGWRIDNILIKIDGLKFSMKKGTITLVLKSDLIGRHLVAPLALAAYLAHESGMTKPQIEKAIAKIKPFEHRMEAKQIAGAWVIDDTYNGNIEGMEAGLKLLSELPARRKIYVTPGLVDQGPETERVHIRLGKAIAQAAPDVVVLMKHSITDFIESGLMGAGFKGELIIEDDPLNFYLNLDKFVASGDLVLMQNDWPDNYT